MPHADLKFTTDLVIDSGDLAIVSGGFADGQRIRDRLATFRGEWFLDLQFGPDYRADLLIKNPRLDIISAVLKDEILKSVEGTFTEFSIAHDNKRGTTISYTIQTTEEVITDTMTI